METAVKRTWVGVDVSKKHWDVAIKDSKKVVRFSSDPIGTQALIDLVLSRSKFRPKFETTEYRISK